MAVSRQETEQQESLSDSHRAIVGATAALAGAAVTYALQRAIKRDDRDEQDDEHEEHDHYSGVADVDDDEQGRSDDQGEDDDQGDTDDREGLGEESDNDLDPETERDDARATNESVVGSALSGALGSASGALLPLAEDAAAAAGRWAAQRTPPVVRDHLIPRLIEAFDEAA